MYVYYVTCNWQWLLCFSLRPAKWNLLYWFILFSTTWRFMLASLVIHLLPCLIHCNATHIDLIYSCCLFLATESPDDDRPHAFKCSVISISCEPKLQMLRWIMGVIIRFLFFLMAEFFFAATATPQTDTASAFKFLHLSTWCLWFCPLVLCVCSPTECAIQITDKNLM